MNNLDLNYQHLLQDILLEGTEKGDRTGTGTISVFGKQIRHKMSEGFPLLTTKKMAIKTMMTELKWFLKGDLGSMYRHQRNTSGSATLPKSVQILSNPARRRASGRCP